MLRYQSAIFRFCTIKGIVYYMHLLMNNYIRMQNIHNSSKDCIYLWFPGTTKQFIQKMKRYKIYTKEKDAWWITYQSKARWYHCYLWTSHHFCKLQSLQRLLALLRRSFPIPYLDSDNSETNLKGISARFVKCELQL